jgi:hypothetical protein
MLFGVVSPAPFDIAFNFPKNAQVVWTWSVADLCHLVDSLDVGFSFAGFTFPLVVSRCALLVLELSAHTCSTFNVALGRTNIHKLGVTVKL